MKKLQSYRGHLLAAVGALVLLGSLTSAKADYYRYDDHHDRPYGDSYYSQRGYWDGHHHFHEYDYRDGHRGYYDNRGGVRVFINI